MSQPAGVRAEFMALFLVVGAGTYLMRALPLLAALGHLGNGGRRRADGHGATGSTARASGPGAPAAAEGDFMFALRLVAPAVIAALLASSVLPAPSAPDFWRQLGVSLAALLPTAWVAARWRNLGLTVLAGVASYWALSLVS